MKMLLNALSVLTLVSTCVSSVLPNYNELYLRREDAIADGVPLRILPFGDSITWGQGSSDGNGWRLQLYNKLYPGNHVEYVGGVKSGKMEQNAHEGHQGYDIELIQHGDSKHKKGMPKFELQPNVVLLMLGTNNIVRNVSYNEAPSLLGSLIDEVVVGCPDAAVLVGTITPLRTPNWEKMREAYNLELFGIVTKFAESGKKVSLVDMDAVKANHINTNDKVHPTDEGYGIIAEQWYEGIQAVATKGWIKAPVDLKAVINQSGTVGSGNQTNSTTTADDEVEKVAQAEDLVEEGKKKAAEQATDEPEDGSEKTGSETEEKAKEDAKEEVSQHGAAEQTGSQPEESAKPPLDDAVEAATTFDTTAKDGDAKQEDASSSPQEESEKQGESIPLPKGDGATKTEETVRPPVFQADGNSGGHMYLGIFTLFLIAFILVFRRQIFSRIVR